MKKIFFCFALVWLVSCSSLETINVQIEKPAQITVPHSIRHITVVNNAIPQPADVGHIIKIPVEKKIEVSSDSTTIILTEALGQFMNEENHFEKVQSYDTILRNDGSFLSEIIIDSATIRRISELTDADAILSVDRFITRLQLSNEYIDGYKSDYMEVRMQAKFRLYSKNGDLLHLPFMFSDTLYWYSYDKPIPKYEDALKEAAIHTAASMVKMFIPYWQEQNRWYYTDNTSRMKKASKYVLQNNWKEAALLWGEEFEKEEKTIRKARIASNIALANEMLDDISHGLTWANISYELFFPARDKESVKEDFSRASALRNVLLNRINDFKKLDEQKGIFFEEP